MTPRHPRTSPPTKIATPAKPQPNIPTSIPTTQHSFMLDKYLSILRLDGALNGDKLNFWICNLEAYFKTQPTLTDAQKILVVENMNE